MKNFLVKDKQTGDEWVIPAEDQDRAREIASQRRQAKQGTVKQEAPVESPTWYGAIPGFLKEAVSAPYKGEMEDIPGFWGSLINTYKEGGQAIARSLRDAVLPPFMRAEYEADPFGKGL